MNTPVHRPPRTDRSVWTAAELDAVRAEWETRFNAAELAELRRALATAKHAGATLDSMSRAVFPLPGLERRMAAIAQGLENGSGVALMRGLPVHDFEAADLELLFAGLATYLGVLLAQSVAGERIGTVADSGETISAGARGTKTRDRLPFHTDRSDIIGLLCVREAATGGESYVVSATRLYNEIRRRRPDLLEALCAPFWHRRTSWEAGGPDSVYPLPVFAVRDDKFAVRYLRHFIRTAQDLPATPRLDDLQLEALDFLDALCLSEEMLVRMHFEPGDIQWLNNFVVLHGRAAYEDTAEPGSGRLLYRAWLASPHSRALPAGFAAIYGRTEAGVLRGGALPPSEVVAIA